MIKHYLNSFAFLDQQIKALPEKELNMVIVIPSRIESSLIDSLQSVLDADLPEKPYEVIVVFNHPLGESSDNKAENERLFNECSKWIDQREIKNIHLIKAFDLPDKHAGVGLARKVGMDEALWRFGSNERGIIVALDADCKVNKNYLRAIEKAFALAPDCNAASIYFQHSTIGLKEPLLSGIVNYELHLRYYNQLLKYSGHPYAYHTVGSSMAVRASAYYKQGGMNKRKAGEDFYFLQKLIQLGNFIEIKDAIVYPSARISDRVPFGTGRAMGEWVDGNKIEFESYHPEVAEDLKHLFKLIKKEEPPLFSELTESIGMFFGESVWEAKMKEIEENTSTKEAFILRFFQWFNLFMCFKFVHFYRDNFKANIPVSQAASTLLKKLNVELNGNETNLELLDKFRKREAS